MLRKISKCKWLIEEDQTYNFFHLFMKDRLRHNNITALRHVDTLFEDAHGIKAFMFDHFNSRIQGSNHRMHKMDGVCSNKLSMEYRTKLEAPFSLLDLKQAIWNSTKCKIPNTNRFTKPHRTSSKKIYLTVLTKLFSQVIFQRLSLHIFSL